MLAIGKLNMNTPYSFEPEIDVTLLICKTLMIEAPRKTSKLDAIIGLTAKEVKTKEIQMPSNKELLMMTLSSKELKSLRKNK